MPKYQPYVSDELMLQNRHATIIQGIKIWNKQPIIGATIPQKTENNNFFISL